MEDKWVLVALYPDGRVCSAAVINYCEEAEFRKENEGMRICFVPGPVILGAPLSDNQQAVSIDDLSAALNELATLRAQVEAIGDSACPAGYCCRDDSPRLAPSPMTPEQRERRDARRTERQAKLQELKEAAMEGTRAGIAQAIAEMNLSISEPT